MFEHPASASSWRTPHVQAVANAEGVFQVTFDQCMFGLVSKVTQTPMRKRTRLLTNCQRVRERFSNGMCDNSHDHQIIEGAEGGMKRSVWAQHYPIGFVEALVDCL